uniref:Uncharacterized protein n=1 Tax=Arundo donax TaxID=35708 RepID=A0A0A9BDX2_ARUDO
MMSPTHGNNANLRNQIRFMQI